MSLETSNSENESPLNDSQCFSVVIPVYGGDDAEAFSRAIESIVMQTIEPSEIVLVVDGPVSGALLQTILRVNRELPKLVTIWIDEVSGHANARRIGIEQTNFELVAMMDSDDICLSHRFEKQILTLQNYPEVSVVGGQIREFESQSNKTVGYRLVPNLDREIKHYLRLRCPLNQVTVMFRKSHVLSVGGYIDWPGEEDYFLWIRMAEHGYKFFNLNDVLVDVRVDQRTYQRRGGKEYFMSEIRLQYYMYQKKLIGPIRLISNVGIRLFVQILIPNKVRGLLFGMVFRQNSIQE